MLRVRVIHCASCHTELLDDMFILCELCQEQHDHNEPDPDEYEEDND